MIRSQLRPLSQQHDCSRLLRAASSSLRQFSTVQPRADGRSSDGPESRTPPISKTKSGPRPNNSPRPRPQRGVDARSLGAPSAGGQPPVFRSPGPRKPAFRKPNPARKPPRTGPRSLKPNRRRAAARMPEEEEGDHERADEVNKVYRELAEKSKPVPIRHDPERPDFSTLRETWPSLPTDADSYARTVSEKLAGLSERYPNGYEPPHELGKRLYDGKSVLFSSDTERAQAIEEARKLAQKHADKLTQEKGDLVEAEDVSFEPISEADRKSLLGSLVKGDYSEREPHLAANKQPVFGDIVLNLGNNPTYRTAGKSSQLVAKVESLLSSSRPPAGKRG